MRYRATMKLKSTGNAWLYMFAAPNDSTACFAARTRANVLRSWVVKLEEMPDAPLQSRNVFENV